MDNPVRRMGVGLACLAFVIVAGTVGYTVLGFSVLDAFYQTIATITTVGFRELEPLSAAGKIFTIVLILAGVGTALYTFGILLEVLLEGHLRDLFGRRRMERDIRGMTDHVIICGWGRVGRAIAEYLSQFSTKFVVIDRDPDRTAQVPHPFVQGDATDDEVLRKAVVERARALVAAVTTDADNLYVTLSSRALRPDLVIIARARTEASESKLRRAGANRVVNPQRLGGHRMAAFALQPHVIEFLDVVMHDASLDFRLEEVPVAVGSSLASKSLRDAHIRDRTGALVLATRDVQGAFNANPAPEEIIEPEQILIAIGTSSQLEALIALAGAGRNEGD